MDGSGKIANDVFLSSEQTEKLDEALAKAQGQIKGAIKDAANPFFKSKYADLASVWEACRDALSANGISVSQWPIHTEDGLLHIITRLACAGQWLRAEFSIPVAKGDAQGYVAAVTYGRRCALSAAVGVAPEDDDGNAAAKSMQDLRAKALAILTTAAQKGTASLESGWKTLSQDMREAAKPEWASLKKTAAEHDHATARA